MLKNYTERKMRTAYNQWSGRYALSIILRVFIVVVRCGIAVGFAVSIVWVSVVVGVGVVVTRELNLVVQRVITYKMTVGAIVVITVRIERLIVWMMGVVIVVGIRIVVVVV